ncbi:TPM domain-containing protein [Candidatus Uhrbacteria bacterium]|nr:TPM domain-containing protein [Candidatus Uhrbacteria bacterium]
MGRTWNALVFLAVTLFSAFTWAQQVPPCDPVVVDGAEVFGADTNRVEAAAQPLINRGATVRIRTVRTYGSYGSLDHLEDSIEKACPSWQAPGGGTRNGLIVLMIAVDDRKVGIYSGDQWKHVVASNWDNIQDRSMKPRFRDGDFAGGFIAGMEALHRLIEQAESAPAGGGVTVVQQPPLDLSGCANVGWFLCILVFIGFLAWAGYDIHTNRKRRRAAQAAAQSKKKAAATRVTELEGARELLKAKVEIAAALTAETDAVDLCRDFGTFDEVIGRGSAAYTDLGNSASDPDRGGRTLAEYQRAEHGYDSVIETLERARKIKDTLERMIAEIQKAAAEAPEMIAEAEDRVVEANSVITAMKAEGWKTGDAETQLASASSKLGEARAALAGKQAAAATAFAKHVIAATAKAKEAAEGLPKRKAAIAADCGKISSRLQTVRAAIEESRTVFTRLTEVYAESSWEAIVGNGSEAEEHVEVAVAALEASRAAATMEEQRWEDAERAAKEGNDALGHAEALARAIVELEERIKVAEREAPREIEDAQADINRAKAYEQKHDADIDDAMKGEIRKAETTLAQARDELAKTVPDFLQVVNFAQKANAHADRILENSRSQYEAAERLRRQAASALREAETAVSRARNYIASHSSDVEHSARGTLTNAEANLSSAQRADGPKDRLTYAGRAKADADGAYQRAKCDVEEAEEERRRARRAREAALRASYSSRSSTSIGFGGGFGGGRSGGSSGFGFGGRSGGSSKW